MTKIYKQDDELIIGNDVFGHISEYRKHYEGEKMAIIRKDNESRLTPLQSIENYVKENDTPYAAFAELSLVLKDFFVNAPAEGYKMSAYLENPTSGIVINAGVDTKAAITTVFTTEVPPNGFDTFITPQGIAWRFIGSGLGNGDTGRFCMGIASGLKADFGAADRVLFNVKRRHYTETDWLNALAIPGYQISRKLPNKDLGAIALNSPCFSLSDGDLIETALNTDSDITLIIDTFSVEIKQIR